MKETVEEFEYRLTQAGLFTEYKKAVRRLQISFEPRLTLSMCQSIAYMQFSEPLCLQEQLLLKDK